MQTTGDLIKQARLKAGMTQAGLAKKLGITPQAISQYERNIKKPKYVTLQKIATALDTEWYMLFVPDSEEEKNEAISIRMFMKSNNDDIEKAQKDCEELKHEEQVYYEMMEDVDKLSEAGMIAVSQLVFSKVIKESIINDDPRGWIRTIFETCVWHSGGVEELAAEIKELLKIPAFKEGYLENTTVKEYEKLYNWRAPSLK